MEKIKIGIVEDELIVAHDMKALLQDIGYNCLEPCSDYGEAIAMLADEQPDIAILDINLGGKKDGVDVARYIRAHTDIPFIFLTANSDAATVTRARETLPDAYLVKPFHKADLYTAIEVAIFAHNKKRSAGTEQKTDRKLVANALFIKEGHYFHKVLYDDIVYLSSNQNYITIHTTMGRNFLVRATMQDYMAQLDAERIVRVHRSYAVSIGKVEKINTVSLVVGGNEVPVSKNYYDDLLNLLHIS